MRIRLQDVANLAGVSEATVSRVMNDKPGVSDATRSRVAAVLAELGYEPSFLRTSPRVGSVGLIVPELTNPVFPLFAQTMETLLIKNGYVSVLCCAIRAGASEVDYIETLLDRGVSGIISVSGRHADAGGDHSIYLDLVNRGIPLVFVNGHVAGLDVPSVSSDDRQAAITAYDHLRALGHERIGLLAGPDCFVPVIRKLDGFRSAARAAGVGNPTIDRMVTEAMFTVEGGYAGAQRLLDHGATGIIAASDMMALGAIRAVRARGCEVPDDVSVIGFDDTDLMRFTDPPLTTVRQPVMRLAEQAVELLLGQLNQQPVPPREYLLECELIGRRSTALARIAAPA